MPILRRSALTSTLPSVMSGRRSMIVAGLHLLEQVEAAQQRRLARARRADQAHDLVLGDGQADLVEHRVLVEALGHALDLDEGRIAHRLRPLELLAAADQAVGVARQRDRDVDEQHRRDHVAAEVAERRRVRLGLLDGLGDADDADDRGVLLQADEVVQERRDHAPDRLRQDHVAHHLPVAEPERARRHALARMHRLDARAVDLGDVGGVHDHERHDAVDEQALAADPVRDAAVSSPAPAPAGRACVTKAISTSGVPRKKSQ